MHLWGVEVSDGGHGRPSAQSNPTSPSGHAPALPVLKASCLLGTQPCSLCMHGWLSGIRFSACSFLPLKFCCDLLCLHPVVCVLSTSFSFARYDSRSRCKESCMSGFILLVCVCRFFSHAHICAARAWLLVCPCVRCRNCSMRFAKTGQQVVM